MFFSWVEPHYIEVTLGDGQYCRFAVVPVKKGKTCKSDVFFSRVFLSSRSKKVMHSEIIRKRNNSTMNGFWNFQEYAFEMGKVQDNLLFKDHSFFMMWHIGFQISQLYNLNHPIASTNHKTLSWWRVNGTSSLRDSCYLPSDKDTRQS